MNADFVAKSNYHIYVTVKPYTGWCTCHLKSLHDKD